MNTVIVAQDKATMDALAQEISATPVIEGDAPAEAVWIWYESDSPVNDITYAVAADGRCAVSHRWGPLARAWLEAYLADWPGVTIGDDLPTDWVWPETP